MELAGRQLRDTDDAVGTVARAVGYHSEYAFNRAFARRHGNPPGRYRHSHRPRPPVDAAETPDGVTEISPDTT